MRPSLTVKRCRRWSGQRTAEMRWFLPGEPPDPWRRWFEGRPGAEPEERTDVYLALDSTALGVKRRSGGDQLELKVQERDYGRRPFPGLPVPAAVQGWQKWPLPQRRWGTPRRRLPWVEVKKVRRMVTYQLSPTGAAALTDGSPADGCRVELTRLQVAGQMWCTVGFEAFGAENRQLDALTAAGHAVFSEPSLGAGLDGAVSCAYPEWLQMLP